MDIQAVIPVPTWLLVLLMLGVAGFMIVLALYLRVMSVAKHLIRAVMTARRIKGVLGIVQGKDGKFRFYPLKTDGNMLRAPWGYMLVEPESVRPSSIPNVPVAVIYSDYGAPLNIRHVLGIRGFKSLGLENIEEAERAYEENPELAVTVNPNAQVLKSIYNILVEELGEGDERVKNIYNRIAELPYYSGITVRLHDIIGWFKYRINPHAIDAKISYEVNRVIRRARLEITRLVSVAIAAAVVIIAMAVAVKVLGVV